jgi:hypothetical protein
MGAFFSGLYVAPNVDFLINISDRDLCAIYQYNIQLLPAAGLAAHSLSKH